MPVIAELLPEVTGILVFNDPAVWHLARVVAESFCNQAYPRKHLIVVNTAKPMTLPTRQLSDYEQVRLREGADVRDLVPVREINPLVLSSGVKDATELRLDSLDNAAWARIFGMVGSDYVAFVGFDSIWHPLRLLYVSSFLGDHPVQLSSELRYVRRQRQLRVVHKPDGLPGTTVLRRDPGKAAFLTSDRKVVVPPHPLLRSLSLTILLAGDEKQESEFFRHAVGEPGQADEAYANEVLGKVFTSKRA